MSQAATATPENIRREYRDYTAAVSVRNSRVACALVIALMPAGILLDYFVYPARVGEFMLLRVISSLLAALVYLRLRMANLSRGETDLLCMGWWVLPAFFISWMIAVTEGANSPYYAGLCLVILAVSTVIQATLRESLRAILIILTMYLAACLIHWMLSHELAKGGFLFNSLYFIGLTSIIALVGNYYYNNLRLSEFSARHELAESRKNLEVNNVKLDHQNKELADAIQKLKEAESQLVQTEKLASLGRMSAGIMHEILNPLNFMTTGLFALGKKSKHLPADQQEDYVDTLKDIEEGVSRVKSIVSDLRTFTHPNADDVERVAVTEVLSSALRFMSNEFRDKAQVENQVPDGLFVRANKNKLIQVLVNLIQNSVDALKTKSFPAGERPLIRLEARADERARQLVVRDNGPGIAAEHVDKIFDPFYTTKDVGEGMGLGLSISYRIMEQCGGRILVNTRPGEFCEFVLEFPLEGGSPQST